MKRRDPARGHSTLSNIAFLLRDIARHHPVLIPMMAVELVCSCLTPLLGIYLPKIVVELLAPSADRARLLWTLGGVAAGLIAATALGDWAGSAKYMYYNDMRTVYQKELYYKSLTCDYAVLESPEGLNGYQKAVRTLRGGDWSGTSVMITALMGIASGAVSFALFSGVIASLNPLVVLLLIGLSAVNMAALRFARRFEESKRDEMAHLERKLSYITYQTRDIGFGKDIRMYGMARWLLALHGGLLTTYGDMFARVKKRHFAAGLAGLATLLLRDGAAYAYLIWQVTRGSLGVPEFVLYFGAVTGFSEWVTQVVYQLERMAGANTQMNDMRAFIEQRDAPEPENPAPLPAASPLGIELRDVHFTYSGGKGEVLRGVSLSIAPGERLALVGVNGAGKSTVVKLLCGFYVPTSGEIRINGVDTRRYRRDELFTLFSAVFQDITVFPFSVAENVALGMELDKSRAHTCLERAGLGGVVAKLPLGADTPMLKDVNPNGVSLSGGETQKLLMSRAIYKDAPILILDEPTAALDPIAESETYEHFHQLSQGKTAIYISHRLASTRFCDRIALIEDGEVKELGSHDELMHQGGAYAAMFEVQSRYYKRGAVIA